MVNDPAHFSVQHAAFSHWVGTGALFGLFLAHHSKVIVDEEELVVFVDATITRVVKPLCVALKPGGPLCVAVKPGGSPSDFSSWPMLVCSLVGALAEYFLARADYSSHAAVALKRACASAGSVFSGEPRWEAFSGLCVGM
jgi:hypothetical protein